MVLPLLKNPLALRLLLRLGHLLRTGSGMDPSEGGVAIVGYMILVESLNSSRLKGPWMP